MSDKPGSISGNLTIRQLEVFAMASRSATFSEAARRLGISQPSLSNTIAKIESQIGLRLFDRTTRTMVLTPQGKRLAAVAEELVRNFQASLRNIEDEASDLRGRMAIAVIPSVAAAAGPRALNLFFAEYPAFDVGFYDVAGDKAVAWVIDRVVEFAVVATPPPSSELLIEPLCRDVFHLVCRKDHPLASKRSVSWKDVSAAQLILAGTGAIQRDIESAWQRDGVIVQPRFRIEQVATGLALVAGGLGVAILPGLSRPADLHPELMSVPMGRTRIEREISAVRRTDRLLSAPVRHMLACFKRALDEV